MGIRTPRRRDVERARAAAQSLWTAAHDLDDKRLILFAELAMERADRLAGDAPIVYPSQ